MRLGIDSGGTFTDVVADDGRVAKVMSTPDDPARAVERAIGAVAGDGQLDVLAHGTTVATNALLERRGARVALVATRGFVDEIEIARQVRPSLYDPFVDRPRPLVPRRCGSRCRAGSTGAVNSSNRSTASFPRWTARSRPSRSASCTPISTRATNAQSPTRCGRFAPNAVVCSHEVSPEFREYERMVTTVVEAFLEPVCGPYLMQLERLAREALVMTSAGGLVPSPRARGPRPRCCSRDRRAECSPRPRSRPRADIPTR